MDPTKYLELESKIVDALKTVYDPEMPVNVYDLGLIYNIDVRQDKTVEVTMTLTNPNCPVADELPRNVQTAVEGVEEIEKATINLVFEPEWSADLMSDAAMLELGLF